ncbi:hypothetical protein L6R49_23920 [Myxococcota bacterium]|nr:hypothetical protein [Myxococcota bacterium]
MNAALTALITDESLLQDLRDELVALTAEVNYLDGQVDAAVADLSRRLLVHVSGDRGSPTYLAVFPTAPSAAVKNVATDSQSEYVHAAIRAVSADPSLVSIDIGALTSAQAALEDGLARRATRRAELRVARAKRDATLSAAILCHNQAALRLQLLYPGEKALVKSFFYERPSRADQVEDGEL